MSYKYFVKKIDLKRNVEMELMAFMQPNYGEEGFYRQVGSFNAFFKSAKRRNTHDGFLYYPQDEEDYNFEFGLMRKLGANPKGKTCITHPSIWEFYKAIGYDYKTKKYIC
jgi:hypothetical protein